MLPQGVTVQVLCMLERKCFPLIFFPPPLPKMEENDPYLQVAASTWEAACGGHSSRGERKAEKKSGLSW